MRMNDGGAADNVIDAEMLSGDGNDDSALSNTGLFKTNASVTIPTGETVAEKAKRNEDDAGTVSLLELFKYADGHDNALMLVGALCGAGVGVAMPLFAIILGKIFDDFVGVSDQAVLNAGNKYAGLFGAIGAGVFFCGFGQMACFAISSERQTLRIRRLYLDAILSQEVAWFDYSKSGELVSKISENTVIIREAIGEKLGNLFQFSAMFLTGFIIGFILNWKLTLVIVAITPLLALAGAQMMKIMSDSTSGGLGAYAKAGGVAAEAFTMIRTVASLGNEKIVAQRYTNHLQDAEVAGVKKARSLGIGTGLTFGVYFLSYALAFWYGAKLVIDSENDAAAKYPPPSSLPTQFCSSTYTGTVTAELAAQFQCPFSGAEFSFNTDADVCRCQVCDCGCVKDPTMCVTGGTILTVFFSVIVGAFSLGQAMPSITALQNGRSSAGKIYNIIGRTPTINQNAGRELDKVKGHMRFDNVKFRYPARPDVLVFTKLTLDMPVGSTIALVGGSGCGKSTVTQLMQRFYDPEEGTISLDQVDLREVKPSWLRRNIGLVGQEPVLFALTIADNIAYGLPEKHGMDTKQIRNAVENAARTANAYNFIKDFPDGFETYVGERGSSMSGGQKQRIAIARAIIRDPSILILDEATSALDNESEHIVQTALDKLLKEKKRTTIVVAHRLSTVRHADQIVVLGEGGVLEQGTHDDLKVLNGHYAALLAAAERSQELSDDQPAVSNDSVHFAADANSSFSAVSPVSDEARPKSALSRIDERKQSSEFQAMSSKKHSKDEKAELEAAEEEEILELERQQQETKVGPLPNAKDITEIHEIAEGTQCCSFFKGWPRNASKEKKKKKKKKKEYSVNMTRIFNYSRPEKWLFFPAVLAAIINGASMPLFAILFSNISTVYIEPTTAQIQNKANQFSLYFVYFSVIIGLSYFGQNYFFGIISEKMTTRIRTDLFLSMVRMEVGFFDRKANSVGMLTAKLATDAALVKATVVDRTALAVSNTVTIVTGLIIAFIYGWQLTLVLFALLPLIVIGGAVQMLIMSTMNVESDESMKDANQVLAESVSNIRTVSAFDLRHRLVKLYEKFLAGPQVLSQKKGITIGLGFGFSQGVIFAVYAIAFWYGARLIVFNNYQFTDVINVFFAIVMAGFGAGQAAAMAPDVSKGSHAISSVFRVIDRRSNVDPFSTEGLGEDAVEKSGTRDITLQNVEFAYPSRPDAKVLKQFSLECKDGTTTALVGQSGSGKSTCIQLLERFYDPDAGSVKFFGVDTVVANPRWLRSNFGLVQQEGSLFSGTIFDNIAEGLAGTENAEGNDMVSEERVIQAAKDANAHDYITAFPDGYQTQVGESGSMLSGGQKQRLCLARCLIRNPKVLLLDEATSALDNESERVVQVALDKLMIEQKRTTIVIAHRLTSIQHVDNIAVVDHGVIVEQGTHNQLLALNRSYANLYNAQQR